MPTKPTKPFIRGTLKLRLGNFAAGVANLGDIAKDELRRLNWKLDAKQTRIIKVATGDDYVLALGLLWYLESAPAFWGDDAAMTERSALRRTCATWRRQLGLSPHEKIAVPASAERS